jgi:AcrR family transcriptional regulator
MTNRSKASREAIVNAALSVVRAKGAVGLTIEGVARQAGCAKGLVHYHLKTKRALLDAVANRIADDRIASWSEAFHAPSPADAIAKTWNVLTGESNDGTVRAWVSLLGSGVLAEQTASEVLARFTGSLGRTAAGMLAELGLMPKVGTAELGWLLGSVVEGMGVQILAGGDLTALEEAYAAAWLGILSLTESQA